VRGCETGMNYDKISPALAGVLDDLNARGRPGLQAQNPAWG
jgi:hypothetical protein